MLLLIMSHALIVSLAFIASMDSDSLDQLKSRANDGNPQAQFELASYYESLAGAAGYSPYSDQTVLQAQANDSIAISWFRQAAEQGVIGAMLFLGERDPITLHCCECDESMMWLLRAAEDGSARAQALIGERYSGECLCEEKNDSAASSWFRRAAENGDIQSQFRLGAEVRSGKTVARDDPEGIHWIKMAAQQDETIPQRVQRNLYGSIPTIPQTERQRLSTAVWIAKTLNAQAQKFLGDLYSGWVYVPANADSAFKWYLLSATNGNSEARRRVAHFYADGIGVTQDWNESAKWMRISAETGDPYAQSLMGDYYSRGRGVPQSVSDAFQWYLKSAENGLGLSQDRVVASYFNGQGVAKDTAKAVYWLIEAAEHGVVDSFGLARLGVFYVQGDYVPQNYANAFKWLKRSAEQGYGNAQCLVGAMCEAGQGTDQDIVAAHMWYNLAGAQGTLEARQARDLLATRMTAEQIARAQELAQKWKPIISERDSLKMTIGGTTTR